MDDYFLHLNDQQTGPYSIEQIRFMLRTGKASKNTLYWQDGLTEWLPLSTISDELSPQPSPLAFAAQHRTPPAESDCSRGIYIILALFFGLLGIHNFYAGHLRAGAWQCILFVLLFWTVVVPIGLFVWVVIELFTVTTDGKGRVFK